MGDLDIAWVLGLLGLSSRATARPVESDAFIRDRISDGTKRVSAFSKRLVGKAIIDDYRGSAYVVTIAWPCFYFGHTLCLVAVVV